MNCITKKKLKDTKRDYYIIPQNEYDEIIVIRFRPISKINEDEDYKIKLKLFFCHSPHTYPTKPKTTRITTTPTTAFTTGIF